MKITDSSTILPYEISYEGFHHELYDDESRPLRFVHASTLSGRDSLAWPPISDPCESL